jgi:hypothetical protein
MSLMKIDRRGALTVMVGALLRPYMFTFPEDKCILPQRGDLVIYEDENKDRPLRTNIRIRTIPGFAVLDNRRILLAKS